MEGIFASEGITKSDRNLYTPSSFAKQNLLYVQEVGKLESLTPHVCKRSNIDSYLIMEVLDGKGKIIYENNDIELYKGECIWIDCRLPFEHVSSQDEPWQLAWVHFNGKGAEAFYRFFREKNGSIHFTSTDSLRVQDLIDEIHKNIKEYMSEIKIHGILTQLIVNCALLKSEKNAMEEVREYINFNYRERDLIRVLAEKFAFKKAEMGELFEKNYGIGIQDYVMNRRFNVAKELLRFTIKPIDEVVVESGIENVSLFYKLFEENEGLSPEEYRRKWAQWIKD